MSQGLGNTFEDNPIVNINTNTMNMNLTSANRRAQKVMHDSYLNSISARVKPGKRVKVVDKKNMNKDFPSDIKLLIKRASLGSKRKTSKATSGATSRSKSRNLNEVSPHGHNN